MTFSMKCSCGDEMKVEAGSHDEAAAKIKGMMDEAAIAKHMSEKHPGQPVMSVADCHAMIDKNLAEVV
jgi:hypothetical protein